jgi:hypothetical protein
MKSAVVFMVAMMIVLLVTTQLVIPTRAENGSNVLSELKQLRNRVAELEERIGKLEKQRSYVAVPQPMPVPPQRRAVPENWQEREFNGLKYYIVPLDKTDDRRLAAPIGK